MKSMEVRESYLPSEDASDPASDTGCHGDRLVLLLKSPKEGQEDDPYKKLLTDAGFKAVFCPVLTFDFLNLDLYGDLLSRSDEFAAIVFTSQQAVKATGMVLELGTRREPLGDWRCYVVGKSTATEAESLGFLPRGAGSGNAEALSEILIKDLKSGGKPILYPCGNLKRDMLPKKMRENGLELREVTVYQTVLRDDIKMAVQAIVDNEGTPDYMVFFSPSGVEASLAYLQSQGFRKDKTKLMSIGETTSQSMTRFKLPISGVCSQPDPESLLDVIRGDT